jgi:tetratricopeptide (TPR) repeat protein
LEIHNLSRTDLRQISRLRQRVESNPDDHFAAYELAQLLWEAGDSVQAVDICRRLVEIPEISSTLLEAVAKFLVERKILKEAVPIYERLAAMQPNRALPHYYLGRILEQLGDRGRAIREHDTSIELEPENAECHYRYGVTLSCLERYEEAEQYYRRAIVLDQAHGKAYSNLGYLLDLKGEGETALQLFRKAVQFNPQSAAAHFNLGALYGEAGLHERAIQHRAGSQECRGALQPRAGIVRGWGYQQRH